MGRRRSTRRRAQRLDGTGPRVRRLWVRCGSADVVRTCCESSRVVTGAWRVDRGAALLRADAAARPDERAHAARDAAVPARRRPDANGCDSAVRAAGVSSLGPRAAVVCLQHWWVLHGAAFGPRDMQSRPGLRSRQHAPPHAMDAIRHAPSGVLAPAVVVVRSAEPRGRRGRAAASVVGIAQHDRDPSGVAAWAVGPCGRVPRVGRARAAL